MKELIWRWIARRLATPRASAWLIQRAQRTPYTVIASADGKMVYMARYWLFNRYDRPRWYTGLLPSIRVHHIKLPDQDRHLHDHPWNARTIVLKGYYQEQVLPGKGGLRTLSKSHNFRGRGNTAKIGFGMYHRVTDMPLEGVWTLFITWRLQGVWGFLVNGAKVPYWEYIEMQDEAVRLYTGAENEDEKIKNYIERRVSLMRTKRSF